MAFEITIPRLGWSMEEGIFAGWQKQNGARISRGDVLFELEGEKALQEIEAVDEGILAISPDGPAVGAVLKVGVVIGFLLSEEELQNSSSSPTPVVVKSSTEDARPALDDSGSLAPAAAPSVRRLARQLGVDISTVSGTGAAGRVTEGDVTTAAEKHGAEEHGDKKQTSMTASIADLAAGQNSSSSPGSCAVTPRARRAAMALGVDLAKLVGTGRGGRVRERDVLAAAPLHAGERQSGGERVVLSGRRKTIAARLTESARQTVPVTITTRADATNLMSLRAQFKSAGQSPVPAIHDIVAKLVGDALLQHPLLGSRWDNDAIVLPDPSQIHIGLAVDTPEGLIVPVLRNINTSSLLALASESARVIQKARSGRLGSADMQGAVFTITNLGGFGIDAFTPVINLPETAILGLGAVRKEPVVADDGTIQVRQLTTLSLTFDHRVIDGAPAARFLQMLVSSIENAAAKLISLGS
jgi:pyruvate dehydrogenase E2 component (dihydrolipoamide acetyltransferase)